LETLRPEGRPEGQAAVAGEARDGDAGEVNVPDASGE
jgi:hypothetical protein